jgi:uncharacterized protein (TIGR00730 family)
MELHFRKPNPGIDEQIKTLVELAGIGANRDIIGELIIASLKAGQDTKHRGDLKMINSTLKEMRYTAKVFGPYRDRLKVSIFGSARTRPNNPYYGMAMRFAHQLVRNGFIVITGGGPGIMEAANKGAGRENSFAVTIKLPFEQTTNETMASNPRMLQYKYFFNRKVAFIKEAHAIALFPGGFGTMDEAMEAMTLVQTGKQNPIPIVLLETKGDKYWEKWMEFMQDYLVKDGYILPADIDFVSIASDVKEAVKVITSFYRRYHSMRYVGDLVVLRLKARLEEYAIQALNEEFSKDLLPGGSFEARGALPEEEDEPELFELPRLIFPFNKKSFVSLKSIIERVNSF